LRHEDGSIESATFGPSWHWNAKSGTSGRVYIHGLRESVRNSFSLSEEVNVPVGEYDFFAAGFERAMSHTDLLQLNVAAQAGTFYDGWQATLLLFPVWYASAHLNVTGSYQFSKVSFPDRDQGFDAHLLRLRIGTALDTKLSANSLLQYSSASNYLSANIRFRYNFREGNDLWLVFNQGINSDRERLIPSLPVSDTSTFLVKYTHTFEI